MKAIKVLFLLLYLSTLFSCGVDNLNKEIDRILAEEPEENDED